MQPGSPVGKPSDELLAERARAGCAASFELLMRRHQVPVLHFLRHRALAADAEDLAQETFLRAYENLDRYRPAWSFATWLFTIARRVSINHYRRARPTADSPSMEQLEDHGPEPMEKMAEEEDRRGLWSKAAEVLSESQMTAVWLYYVEDLPVKQIARVLEVSQPAVKTLLFRARKKLMPFLQDRQHVESTLECLPASSGGEVNRG